MKAPRILHYPGAKWSIAEWIISYMPEHTAYLEPFMGSGAVLFNKVPASLETVNDLDGDIVNLFSMIRNRPEELARLVEYTPYSRQEYYSSYDYPEGVSDIERARIFLVRCWMARGARSSDRNGWRHVIDANGPRPVRQWNEIPEKIMQITERLKALQIEQQPAVKLIKRYKHSDYLIYADPPYVLETRRGRIYKHEMNNDDHIELLDTLDEHPGPVILSGYAHSLYDDRLKHWRREELQVKAEAGQKRTEVLWINEVASDSGQMSFNL